MSRQGPKQALFAQLASMAKTLGHPHRIELLELLAQRERSVEATAGLVGLSVANASQHLQQLRRAGLCTSRREGKFRLYRLADDDPIRLLGLLRQVAEKNLAEVDRILHGYYAGRDQLEPVSRTELVARLQSGRVAVVDVRPVGEWAAGHLPGAVSIPLDEISTRLSELDPSVEIVAYCRGPYCILAFEAVATLRARGFAARRLEDGLPEWKAAGLPVVAA